MSLSNPRQLSQYLTISRQLSRPRAIRPAALAATEMGSPILALEVEVERSSSGLARKELGRNEAG
jgi:hypothetical protein